jgi:prepilin-type processing-associated H-X9-DG protein
MSFIRGSSEVILLVDVTSSTLNDGGWEAPMYDDNGNWVKGSGTLDLLSIVHDRRGAATDSGYKPLNNPDRKGNVTFVDGHAEYVPRQLAHSRRSVDPKFPY